MLDPMISMILANNHGCKRASYLGGSKRPAQMTKAILRVVRKFPTDFSENLLE